MENETVRNPIAKRFINQIKDFMEADNLKPPDSLPVPAGPQDELSPAFAMANHAVRHWFPQILGYQGLHNSAGRIRDTTTWKQAEDEALRAQAVASANNDTDNETDNLPNAVEAAKLTQIIAGSADMLKTSAQELRPPLVNTISTSTALLAELLQITAQEAHDTGFDLTKECRELLDLMG